MVEVPNSLRNKGPYEVRLLKYSIHDMVDNSLPTTVIEYLEGLEDPDTRLYAEGIVRELLEKDPEYKERFEKIREAMKTIRKLNFPRFW